MATIRNVNGRWYAECGAGNVVATDTTPEGLMQQLSDLGIEAVN